MNTGWTLLAGGAAGALIGGAVGAGAVVVEYRRTGAIMEEDARRLEAGHPLPSLPEPPQPEPRSQRGMLRCYAAGIALGGFVVWLAVFTLIAVLDTSPQGLLGAIFFGAVAGVVGFIFPGLLIGAGLWLRESRTRIRQQVTVLRHQFWAEREWLRSQVESGAISPAYAVAILRGEAAPPAIS